MISHKQDDNTLDSFFRELDRSAFIDNEYSKLAHYDSAFPIGYGQTISQPTLVYAMTRKLELDKRHRVLEIGTGSGYQTAFLARFSREVYTMELICDLSKKAEKRLHNLGYGNISFKVGDGSLGWPEYAPFDRIIVTAGAGRVPVNLVEQLGPEGRMLVPVGEKGLQELILITRDKTGAVTVENLGDVVFVEFKGEYGWDGPGVEYYE